MSTPTFPPVIPGAVPQQTGGATAALIIAIVSLLCCGGALSPVAWYLGNKEMKAVDAGMSAISNRGLAQVSVILGIVGTVFLAVWLIVVAIYGFAVFAFIAGAIASGGA